MIKLYKETPKEAVCQVFEKVSTGGVSLTVFELLTATYAADDFNLRDDWSKREHQLKQNTVMGELQSTDFLMALTLLATYYRKQASLQAGTPPENAPTVIVNAKKFGN